MIATRLVLIVAFLLSVSVGMTANAAATETGRNYLATNETAIEKGVFIEQPESFQITNITHEEVIVVFENPIVLTPEFTINSASKVLSPICQSSRVAHRARDRLIRQCFGSIFIYKYNLSNSKQNIINRGARIRML